MPYKPYVGYIHLCYYDYHISKTWGIFKYFPQIPSLMPFISPLGQVFGLKGQIFVGESDKRWGQIDGCRRRHEMAWNTAHYVILTAHCTLQYTTYYTLYNTYYLLHTIQYLPQTIQHIIWLFTCVHVYTAYYIAITAHCTLHTIQYSMNTAHYTLCTNVN